MQKKRLSMSDIKLCPFCGTVPNSGVNYGIGGAYVNCVNRECLCNPEVFVSLKDVSLEDCLEKAKIAWNNRLPDKDVDAAYILLHNALKSLDDIGHLKPSKCADLKTNEILRLARNALARAEGKI